MASTHRQIITITSYTAEVLPDSGKRMVVNVESAATPGMRHR